MTWTAATASANNTVSYQIGAATTGGNLLWNSVPITISSATSTTFNIVGSNPYGEVLNTGYIYAPYVPVITAPLAWEEWSVAAPPEKVGRLPCYCAFCTVKWSLSSYGSYSSTLDVIISDMDLDYL